MEQIAKAIPFDIVDFTTFLENKAKSDKWVRIGPIVALLSFVGIPLITASNSKVPMFAPLLAEFGLSSEQLYGFRDNQGEDAVRVYTLALFYLSFVCNTLLAVTLSISSCAFFEKRGYTKYLYLIVPLAWGFDQFRNIFIMFLFTSKQDEDLPIRSVNILTLLKWITVAVWLFAVIIAYIKPVGQPAKKSQ
ncbi:aspartyl/glutamyl-tRNA(Asn/Gln) amidotransferase subunit B [Acrasis kona]|uniref:Aspartyl/glutamyl-tRNA(Asn/Gln) amidotransferase subunit B n=1 Tax=Acrasis kona TaxID=1008807 RepID=A0AAW2ZP04_9EUKA